MLTLTSVSCVPHLFRPAARKTAVAAGLQPTLHQPCNNHLSSTSQFDHCRETAVVSVISSVTKIISSISSVQFSSRRYPVSMRSEKAHTNYALHPVSQKFPQRCLLNGSNVRLIDDGPLSSPLSSTSLAFAGRWQSLHSKITAHTELHSVVTV